MIPVRQITSYSVGCGCADAPHFSNGCRGFGQDVKVESLAGTGIVFVLLIVGIAVASGVQERGLRDKK